MDLIQLEQNYPEIYPGRTVCVGNDTGGETHAAVEHFTDDGAVRLTILDEGMEPTDDQIDVHPDDVITY